MNKSLVYVVLLVLIALVGALWLRSANTQHNPAVSRITPTVIATATVTTLPQDTILKAVAEELSKKYNKPADTYVLTVAAESGAYAKGSVTVMGEGGGGLWFAAQNNGVWKLVYDGNGIITCGSLAAYPQFPTALIPQCFDESSNTMMRR